MDKREITEEIYEEALTLYRTGKGCPTVGRELHISDQLLLKMLKERGHLRRPNEVKAARKNAIIRKGSYEDSRHEKAKRIENMQKLGV